MDRTKKNQIIKDNINFLEYPNWIVTEREKIKEITIEKEHGIYKLSTSADNLPDKFDKIVLYYLLCTLLNNSQLRSTEIRTTRYKVARSVFYKTKNVGKSEYDRIILALKRWTAVLIEFEGVFYDGDEYTSRYFHIIDNVILNKKTKELFIQLNDQYIQQLRETNYFKFINFDKYKLLKRPVSARLYEILIKTFKDRDQWQIGIIKLAEKLTLEKREGKKNYYPSDVIIKLNPAVNEITKNTELKINLDYNKQTHVCTFMKVKPIGRTSPQENPQEKPLPEDDRFHGLTSLLPKEHHGKKTIHEAVNRAYQKHGFDYAARNIKYTNKNCHGNYRAYLSKALKEDWGLALEEDEKRKQKLGEQEKRGREEQRQKEHEDKLKRDYERYVHKEALRYKETLSRDEIERIEEEARRRVEKKNPDDLTFNVLMIFEMEDSLAAQAGALSFGEWKKQSLNTLNNKENR